jgi:hypothetical protein
MPLIGLAHLLIAILFASHAIRTGRPQFWVFILLLLPVAGAIAYVAIEILPEIANSRRARQVAGNISDVVHPHGEWERRRDAAERTDNVQTKLALAEECERKSMWADAIRLYEAAAQGIFATDGAVLFGLARAQLGAGNPKAAEAALDRLREAHPDIKHQEAHLLYARALEEQDRLGEAEEEYEALADYYVGLEARTRYGLLLLRTGQPEEAHRRFDSVARAGAARGIVLTDADKKWLKVAKANLA